MLRTLGVGAGVALGAPSLLAACGDSSSSSGSKSTSTTARATTSTAAASTSLAGPPPDPNRPYWMQGNFRPVTVEETVTDLEVSGKLPAELSGLFVRNGSNTAADTDTAHWFLGDGMIHGVRLEAGKATWYRNRYVGTPLAEARKDLLAFGGVPGQANNQSNVALIHHAGKLLSLGEVGWPFELNPTDLSTVGAWDFDGRLGSTMTAHPKIDPATGRLHFFGYEILSPTVTYYAATPDGVIDVVSPITLGAVTMIHDFAITETHAVFWIGPVVFGPDAANPYPQIPFHWDPTAPCRVGVMPLNGAGDPDLVWIDLDPCFVFHGLNAWNDGDDVVVNLCQMDQAFGRQGDLVRSYPTEWRISPSTASPTVSQRQLTDRSMDLPSHDRRFTGRPTRHSWLATTGVDEAIAGPDLTGLCHLDLKIGREDVWSGGDRYRAGEGFFVPAAENSPEGEGWILTYLYDRTTDRSSLGVFDAQDLKAGPVAQVQLGVRVPYGFHGWWLDESLL